MKTQNKLLIFAALIIFVILVGYFFIYSNGITGKVTTETVVSAGDVGKYSSIAIDSNDKAHISFKTSGLDYCNNTAGSWSCITVEIDGTYSSIAIDSNDKVHISHQQDTGAGFDLRYCNNTAGSWSCAIAETTGGSIGLYTSISIDSNNKIHISHYDATGGDLRYCNNTEGSWSCADVETGSIVGVYSSIAIDSNDKIHISHLSQNIGDLRYCNNTAGSWSCTAVDTSGSMGIYSSIAIDSNDSIHISHYDDTNNNLRYCNNTGGTWSCADILPDPLIDEGQYTSIAIDSSDKIHISHYDATNDDLRYCNNINGTWFCKKLADADANNLGTPNGRALALKKGRIVDSTSFSGLVHMSWYNNTDLLYTNTDPFYPTLQFESLTTATGNFFQNFISANITANDTSDFTITISLYNSTSLVQSNTSSTSPLFINFTNLPEETYKLNATVNDSDNTNQTETRTIILDTTNPTATFKCSPSVVTLGDTITCTCSGSDSGSGVDTTSSSSTIVTDTTGSITQSGCTVTDLAGNSASATGNYEVLSSGGGGILDSEGPSIEKIHLLPSVNPEDETKVEFDSGTGIKEIQIQVSSKASNVRIKVSKYDSKPIEVSKDISGKVYRYLEISTENLGDKLEKVIVTIQVEKSWVSDQGLNKEDVKMFKFDNSSEKWNELETVFDSEDDNFYIYSVELDSFSFFAIGEKVKEETGEVGEIPVTEKINLTWIWILIGIVVLVIIYLIRKKREESFGNNLDDFNDEKY